MASTAPVNSELLYVIQLLRDTLLQTNIVTTAVLILMLLRRRNALIIFFCLSPYEMVDEKQVEALITRHLERRPLTTATDIYKLLYQGVFGVGHLLHKDARGRLEMEARTLCLDEQPEETLIEEVSIDGTMVRVNLRPYLKRDLPLERLYSAMEKSELEEGRTEEFIEVWKIFKRLVRSGRLRFDEEEVKELDREIENRGCLPRHHSEVYRRAYSPAYRVVKRSVIEWMFETIP